MKEQRVRREVRVYGTVQGVGFRPFVFSLARRLELSGFVLNDDLGVRIEVEGPEDGVDVFIRRLPDEQPPLALIERVEVVSAPAPCRRCGLTWLHHTF